MVSREWKYKGYVIELNHSGWFSAKSDNLGYLKADTLFGIKRLIDKEIKVQKVSGWR